MLEKRHKWFCHVFLVTFIITLITINFQMTLRLISVDYKVFGRVQGVFFRKFTKKKAEELGIRGYVQNAMDGTVVGTIQGSENQINSMKNWLTTTGSPYSVINECCFTNQRFIDEYEFIKFEVRH